MTETFFDRPILNSPYARPARHWELDADGQPTNRIIESRRRSDLITPVPKPKKRRQNKQQGTFDLGAEGLSFDEQEYNPTPIINEVRDYVAAWRNLPRPDQWQVTAETQRLLQHWRHYPFDGIRPFFCQIEAVETVIWPVEVAGRSQSPYRRSWRHVEGFLASEAA
jgi:type III restriction enzyme